MIGGPAYESGRVRSVRHAGARPVTDYDRLRAAHPWGLRWRTLLLAVSEWLARPWPARGLVSAWLWP